MLGIGAYESKINDALRKNADLSIHCETILIIAKHNSSATFNY